MNTVQIRVLKDIPENKAGTCVHVRADTTGTPLGKFWRDRLRDAKVDQCVEIVPLTQPKSKPSKEDK